MNADRNYVVATIKRWNLEVWSTEAIGVGFSDHFVDISTTLERKMVALEAYREEMRRFRMRAPGRPGQRSPLGAAQSPASGRRSHS